MNTFTPNTEGVFEDLEAATYHAAPGVSNSMLKHLNRSPAHLKTYMAEDKREPSAVMTIGTIAHHMLLTPDEPQFWAVVPEGMKLTTKDGIAWKAANETKTIIKHDDMQRVIGMVKAVRSHATAARALLHGDAEVSLFRNFNLGGTVLRKARIDFVNHGNALVDIKTVDDARPESFSRQVFDMGYHRQAAYYLDIWNDCNPSSPKQAFTFIAVERDAPHGICVYQLHADAIGLGRQSYIDLLSLYIECRDNGKWPCYDEQLQVLELPAWAMKRGN